MITITRLLARQLRTVFRRVLNITPKGVVYPIVLDAGPNGLCVRALNHKSAVEYRQRGNLDTEQFSLPFQFLVDCEGRKDDPVTIEALSKKQFAASWQDGNVPQVVRYEQAESHIKEEFPALPDMPAENPPELLSALHNASETSDSQATRYAIGCILLRGGDGSICATDGRQLLVQSGFALPWQDEVLIPASTVFGFREFSVNQPVYTGRNEDWVSIKAGQWTIHLRINKDGRFPQVESHIPSADAITTHCRLSAADAEFLAAILPRLPCDDDQYRPVTVDLNGSVAIRAKPTGQRPPTECVLSNSTWSGEPLRLNTDRRYLARAIKLGFTELQVVGPKSPLVCRDERRAYVWMPLETDSAIGPCDEAIRIVSPPVASIDQPPPTHIEERNTKPVSEPTTTPNTNQTCSKNGNGKAKTVSQSSSNGHARKSPRRPADQREITAIIEQAESIREALRGNLLKTNDLIKALKRHRHRSRIVANTLASLRQLKTIGV